MPSSVELGMLSVSTAAQDNGSGSQFGFQTYNYGYGPPNYAPSTYFGNLSRADAVDSGLASDTAIAKTFAAYGIGNIVSIIQSYATLDKMAYTNNWSAYQTFMNASFLAAQSMFRNDWVSSYLSGGAFSPVKALMHYIGGSGEPLFVDISKIGLNVSAQDVPSMRMILKNPPPPGTYPISEDKIGYQTYKDSKFTGAYLGGIVIKVDGTLTINADSTYSYQINVTQNNPDHYDADPKKAGDRPGNAEWSTAVLHNIPGKEYDIYMTGSQSFSGSGTIGSTDKFSEILTGDYYDNTLITAKANQTLSGGIGDDNYVIYTPDTIIVERPSEGSDRITTYVNYTMPDNTEELYLAGTSTTGIGNNSNNFILGNDYNNFFRGNPGDDTLIGKGGTDTAVYQGSNHSLTFVSFHGHTVLSSETDGKDALYSIENILAGNRNLVVHDNIMQYVASYGDLRSVYGSNADSMAQAVMDNFIQYNDWNSRPITFDGGAYLINNRDVYNAYGFSPEEAARHYISYGASEGRGYSFDTRAYIASYGDLIDAFGFDLEAASRHFLLNGEAEGRHVMFDVNSYMQLNPDVAAYAAGNTVLAVEHYIEHGYHEGRSWHI